MASFQSLSGFLARCNVKGAIDDYESFFAFQSLSGFLARCNSLVLYFTVMPSLAVSIPVGFSCSLQHWPVLGSVTLTWPQFQSLSGFLARCNYTDTLDVDRRTPCFNPCRVFLLVATESQGVRPDWKKLVSIPVGFSCSLQL